MSRWLMRFIPKSRHAAVEAESRSWVMDCKCGHTTSIWEMGGIRYKAKSTRKVQVGRCGGCGRKLVGPVRQVDSN